MKKLTPLPSDFLPELLAVRPLAPELKGDVSQIILALRVPPTLAHFPGHFPGLPVLPGVVQIDWAMRYAREHLPLSGHFKALENIKFLALVLPDAQLELRLKWDEPNKRLEFMFSNSERKYSSGRIVLGEAP